MACASGGSSFPATQLEPWPVYLGTQSRSPSAGESLAAQPRLRWRTNVGRAIPGGIAVTEDYVVAGTSDRHFAVLDRQTGEILWRKKLAGSVSSVPIVAGATVYAATERPDGRVYALRLQDGKKRWEANTGPVTAHLALAGGLLLAARVNEIAALDTATGEHRWRTRISGAVRAAPTVFDGHVFVTTVTDSAFVVRVEDGAIVGRVPLDGTVIGTPALADAGRHELVAATASGTVFALTATPAALDERWSVQVDAPVVGHVAVAGDTAFAVTRVGSLWIIPLADPGRARRHELKVGAVAGPAPFAQGVFVATIGGEVLWIDAATGEVRWIIRVDGPVSEPPIVRNGEMLIVSGRGDILVYR